MQDGAAAVKVGHTRSDPGGEGVLGLLDADDLLRCVVEQIAQRAEVRPLDEQPERVGARVVDGAVQGDDVGVREVAERAEVAVGALQQLGALNC